MPSATRCVACINAAGDVTKVRRYDQFVGGHLVAETYFTDDEKLAAQLERSSRGAGFIRDAVLEETGLLLPDELDDVQEIILQEAVQDVLPSEMETTCWEERSATDVVACYSGNDGHGRL